MKRYKTLKKHIVTFLDLTEQLRQLYPGRRFSLDGKLVGDMGEVYAETHYGVQLYTKQTPIHDGLTLDNKRVQIKATFGHALTFRAVPDYYLGFKIHPNGHIEEIYNGPGQIIADFYHQRKGIGKAQLSFPISKLSELSTNIKEKNRIKKL